MYSYGPPHMAEQKQDDQLEHTYSSCVRIRDVALKTCQRRWTIGRSGERGSGISVLASRHDDYDDDMVKNIEHLMRIELDCFASHSIAQDTHTCHYHVPNVSETLYLYLKNHHYIYLLNPSARAGCDTRSIFKRSLTGMNSVFSFSLAGYQE